MLILNALVLKWTTTWFTHQDSTVAPCDPGQVSSLGVCAHTPSSMIGTWHVEHPWGCSAQTQPQPAPVNMSQLCCTVTYSFQSVTILLSDLTVAPSTPGALTIIFFWTVAGNVCMISQGSRHDKRYRSLAYMRIFSADELTPGVLSALMTLNGQTSPIYPLCCRKSSKSRP